MDKRLDATTRGHGRARMSHAGPPAPSTLHENHRIRARRIRGSETVVLTTYRRDGSPVDTPVHIATDGDRVFIRTYEKAYKAKRLHRRPEAELWLASDGRPPPSWLCSGRRRRGDESVSLAMLVVLETLSPAERAVFVLHDVFGLSFGKWAR